MNLNYLSRYIRSSDDDKIKSKFFMDDISEYMKKSNDYCFKQGFDKNEQLNWLDKKECFIQNTNYIENCENYQSILYHSIFPNFIDKEEISICEYGCGISPLSHLLINQHKRNGLFKKIKIYLFDLDSPQLEFAEWRLNNFISKNKILNIDIIKNKIDSESTPEIQHGFDIVYLINIIEYLENANEITSNLIDKLNVGGLLVENYKSIDFNKFLSNKIDLYKDVKYEEGKYNRYWIKK
jgi:2-polyprenyl-3-methyl-5-hydroxy-6-metoxy-1,4-benzoquinol methylase